MSSNAGRKTVTYDNVYQMASRELVWSPHSLEQIAADVQDLTEGLEMVLNKVMARPLSKCRVVWPEGIMKQMASDVVSMGRNEPLGLRGCKIYLDFDDTRVLHKIGTFKCEMGTLTTFELSLCIKQREASWQTRLPEFLRRLTGGGTIWISEDFFLEKTSSNTNTQMRNNGKIATRRR